MLDNFEQVGSAARDVIDLLAACPGLKVLVTSRAVLHLQIEHEFHVPPLEFPDHAQQMTAEDLLRYPSIALFIERVRTMLPDFPITQSNLQTIAEICMRLDGLPLAIELAAPRVKALSPQGLLERLPRRFEILKSMLQTLPERQKTLYKSMTWSYDLLDADEKWLFRRLAIFWDGGTLETIEELFSERTEQSLDALSILLSLLDQSMLQRKEISGGGNIRFTMLETVRDYGLEGLHQEGELEEVQRAHALHYLALAEKAAPYLKEAQQAEWLLILDVERNNLRNALQWFITHKEGELALRFCEAFGKFCGLRGHWSEERHWLQVVLSLPEASAPTAIRARVLRRAAHLAYRFRDLPTAHTWFAESVRLSRQCGDQHNLVGALSGLGRLQRHQNDIPSARASFEECVAVARAYGDTWVLANALESFGSFTYKQGDVPKARSVLQESITLSRGLYDKESLARGLTTLVLIELASDHLPQADTLAKESSRLAKELGTKPLIALALDSLVEVALFRGQYERAQDLVNERIALAQTLGDTPTILKKRLILGEIAVEQGNPSWVMPLMQESLAFFRQQVDHANISVALGILGDIELAREDFEQAKTFYQEALSFYMKMEDKRPVTKHLIRMAKLSKKGGHTQCVAHILSVTAIWHSPLSPVLRNEHDRLAGWLRTQIGETAFRDMQSQEHAMTLEQLLSLLKVGVASE